MPDDDAPEIPIGNLDGPFNHPQVAEKLRRLSREVAAYRVRRTAAESEARRLLSENDLLVRRVEAAERAFVELTERIQTLRIGEPAR